MAVTIVNQPMDWAGAVGDTAAIWVDAEGDNLTYQWWVKRPPATTFSKSSIVRPVYSFAQPDVNDRPTRELYCVVSDGVDSVQSDTVTAQIGTMSDLQTQLCRLRLGVKGVCDAVIAKGVTIPNSYATLEELPTYIASI